MSDTIQTITVPERPYPLVSVELNQYNASTGEAISAVKSLNFKYTTVSGQTEPVVIKMKVRGVTRVSNIRVAIVNASPHIVGAIGNQGSDGTIGTGNFGIEHSSEFAVKSSLTTFFAGINSTESPSSSYNVSILNSSKTGSEFVYLTAKAGAVTGAGFVTYKWFFDFI